MRLFSGATKVAFGFGLGVVAAEAIKDALPAFRGLGRPLLRAAIKSGHILARDSRLKLAEFREVLADVNAEVRAELALGTEEAQPAEPFTAARKQAPGIM
jgi:hypothetical protein